MKNIYRRLAALLIALQIFSVISVAAGAEYGDITGVKVGSMNLRDGIPYWMIDGVLQEAPGDADNYIFFESDIGTIFMKNFSITVGDASGDPTYAALYIPGDINLVIDGTNELINVGYYSVETEAGSRKISNGINAEGHSIQISGNGSLAVRALPGGEFGGHGILAGTVGMSGKSLVIEAQGAEGAYQCLPSFASGDVTVRAGADASSAWDASPYDWGSFTANPYVIVSVHEEAMPDELLEEQLLLEEQARLEEEARLAEEARLEEERIAAEQEAARAAEEARLEAERIAAEQEAERIAAEQEAARAAEEARIEAERIAAEQEAERIAAEQEAARAAEEARLEAERQAEEARIEAERIAAEQEAERIAAEQEAARAAEEARLEAERIAAEQEAERIAAEQEAARAAEEARLEAERIAAEQAAEEARLAAEAEAAAQAKLEADAQARAEAEAAAAAQAKAEEEAAKAAAAAEAAQAEKPQVVQAAPEVQAEILAVETQPQEPAAEQFVTMLDPAALSSGTVPILPPAVSQSNVVFSADSESSGWLRNVDSSMKYRIGYVEGDRELWTEWMNIDAGDFRLTGLKSGYKIEVARFSGENKTLVQALTIDQQPLISDLITAQQIQGISATAVSGAGSDGTISIQSPTSYSFEFRLKSDVPTAYSDFSGNYQTGLAAGTYQIRIKADQLRLASAEPYEVIVGSYVAPTRLPTPAAVFSATGSDSGVLSGVNSSMRYSLGNSGTWVGIFGETVTIPAGVSGQILIKAFGDGKTTTDSDVQTIILSQYGAPSKANLVARNCSISTQDNGTIAIYYETPCEYRKEGTSVYIPVTERFISNLTPGRYFIRFRAKDAILASEDTDVVIAAYTAPAVVRENRIIMSQDKVTLNSTDSSVTLSVTFDPLNTTDQTVYWTSSDENVVRVHESYRTTVGSGGVATASVIAVGSGTATVVARSANGNVAYSTVSVHANYYFTYHKNGTWYYDRGGTYTVQATGPASRLAAVKLNGQTINPYYYTVATASDGSTIVTISETAMKAMEHRAYQTLQFVYSDGGTASCYLHILSVRDRPITGDDGRVGFWAILMLMSAVTGGVLLTRRKKWD